jgi:hypothetical protein
VHSGLKLAVNCDYYGTVLYGSGLEAGYCISFSANASAYGPVGTLAVFADCDGSWYLPRDIRLREVFASPLDH